MSNTDDALGDKEYTYKKDYSEDWNNHSNYIKDFDAYEAMVISQVYDSVSRSVEGGKITDGYVTTLAKERADRVMAKLPEGATESVGKADAGKAAFMDIIRQKWIYPNANAQHPFLEKLNMWQFYSSVYGYMPMFYDWNVSPSGYVGPDCWLWNPRNLVPQSGRVSIADMDYVTALTWVSKKQLEKYLDADDDAGWDKDALKLLIQMAENEQSTQDTQQDTQVARTREPGQSKKGICLATRYEAGADGKWCTFAPDHSYVQVREIANPHENGRIPFVVKYSQPLFDSFYGLGDFQRGKPLQFARDGLDNFYFTGIKNQLVPPLVANANGTIKHTLDYRAGGVMLETIPNSIRTLEVPPAGMATYQGAKAAMTGALLAQFGSQNASIPGAESQNPSQGKTPQAIDLYADKEATRDGSELRHMEAALEQLTDGFNSILVAIGTEDIPIQLFAQDIEDIQSAGLTDIQELIDGLQVDASGTAADLRIKPEVLKGVEYRFNIDPNSTVKENKAKTLAGLDQLLGAVGKFQNLLKDDPRYTVNLPQIMDTYETLLDLPGVKDFIQFDPNAQAAGPPPPPPPPPPHPMEMVNIKDLAAIAPQAAAKLLESIGLPGGELLQPDRPTADQALKAEDQMHKHKIEDAKLQMDGQKLSMEGEKMQMEKHKLALDAEAQANATTEQGFNQDKAAAEHEQGVVQSDRTHKLAEKTAADKAKVDQAKAKESKNAKSKK